LPAFRPWDTINFSIFTRAFGGHWTLQSGNGTTVASFSTSGTGTQAESYTVTGANQDTTLSQTILGAGGLAVTVTATCTAGASNTDSPLLGVKRTSIGLAHDWRP
jgi:hypothetical protein